MSTLVSLTEAREILGYADDLNDAKLAHALGGASELARRVTGRAWVRATYVERLVGGTSTLQLAETPVASVTSVEDLVAGGLVSTSSYDALPDGTLNRLPLGARWPGGPSISAPGEFNLSYGSQLIPRWKVTYDGGYDVLPWDVKVAVAQIAGAAVANPMSVAAEKDGDYSVTYASSGTPPQALAVLQGYARVWT